MTMIDRPSPNHGPRPAGAAIDILLVHYTGMPTMRQALERMCDPAAEVSAHYLIDEDGTIYRLVPEERRAWHAGRGFWAGERDVNGRSIGVELVNPGHEWGYRPFPMPQMVAFAGLACSVISRHGIARHRVLAHSDVAPARKEDPGELFDWAGLARCGVGLWPDPESAGPAPGTPGAEAFADPGADPDAEAADLLARFGYGVAEAPLPVVLTAFQRHFRPGLLNGRADAGTLARLRALVRLAGHRRSRPEGDPVPKASNYDGAIASMIPDA